MFTKLRWPSQCFEVFQNNLKTLIFGLPLFYEKYILDKIQLWIFLFQHWQGRIEVKKGRRSVVSVVWALERAGCETGFSSPACSPPAPVLVLPLVCSPVKVLDQGGEAKLLITGTSQTRRTTRERPGKLIGLSVNPSQWLCLPGPSLVWVSLFPKVTSLFVPAFLWDCDKCFQLQRGCFPKHPAGLPCHLRHPNAWIQIFFHVERRPDWQDGGNWGSVGGI